MVNNFLKDKFYLIFTLCFIGFGVLIALTTSVINYRTNSYEIIKKLQEQSKSESNTKHQFLTEYIETHERLLFAITDNHLTKEFITNNDLDSEVSLIQLFYALSIADADVMQLRYIDSMGREVIRIDRSIDLGNLSVISKEKLQDKSDRYYFKEAKVLNEGEVWHSNIDLNIENGEIMVPITPTFRVATPVYINGVFEGIVIANLLFQKTISNVVFSPNFDIYLSDGLGESIYSPVSDSSWSKYIKENRSIRDLFPEKIDSIVSNEDYSGDYLYSFGMGHLFKNNEGLKLILVPKSFFISEMKDRNRTAAIIIAITVLLISIPLSWIVSFIPSKLQKELLKAYEEISDQAQIINKNVMITKADKFGHIIDASSKFLSVTGYAKEDLFGFSHGILKHPDTTLEQHKSMYKVYNSGQIWEGDIKDLKKDKKPLWIHLIITPKFDKSGKINSFIGISEDITDKKYIEHISLTDSLTGLGNRRKLEEIFDQQKALQSRHNSPFTVIIIDIDYFKKVNDVYGHLAGDSVLIEFSEILKSNCREIDHICRWGGEEFMIISSNQDLDGAFLFSEKLRSIVEGYNFREIGRITISCGVSQYVVSESLVEIVARVDVALYKAKDSGRNRVIKG